MPEKELIALLPELNLCCWFLLIFEDEEFFWEFGEGRTIWQSGGLCKWGDHDNLFLDTFGDKYFLYSKESCTLKVINNSYFKLCNRA